MQLQDALSEASKATVDAVANPVKRAKQTHRVVPASQAAKGKAPQLPNAPGLGCPTFAIADRDGVYPDRFSGGLSTQTIVASVPINAIGATVQAMIYGKLANVDGNPRVTFAASLPKGMKFPDRTDRENFLAHVELHAASWDGYDKATKNAYARLTDTGKPSKGVRLERPTLALGMRTVHAR